MAVHVLIPDQYRSSAGGQSEANLAEGTVAQILTQLCDTYPLLQGKIFDQAGAKRKTVNIYLNREDIRYADGLETTVSDGDELIILPPASGG